MAQIVDQYIVRVRLVSALATALYLILTVFVPVLVAVWGLVVVQCLVPPERREEQNDVAGFIYAVLGLAYAVLLAFVVIAVWQDYNTAQTNVESEAHELSGVYFLASREEAGEQGVDPAFVMDLVRRGDGALHGGAVGHDRQVGPRTGDACLAEGR